MDQIFKKFQEVAQNPSGETPILDSFTASWGPSTSKEELAHILSAKEISLKDLETKYRALQQECSTTHEEYGAYKAKVQSWRTQAKAAREQDQRTIALLREASQKEGEDGGGASTRDAAYQAGLEEQVKALKEVVRSTAEQRDALQLELQRVIKQMSQGDNNTLLETEMSKLRHEIKSLEKAVEEEHRKASEVVAEYEARASTDTRAQYIKDLEAELKLYRSGRADVMASPARASADAGEEKVKRLAAEKLLETLRMKVAECEAEAEVREVALDSTYASLRQMTEAHDALASENASLREKLALKENERSFLASRVDEHEHADTEKDREVGLLKTQVAQLYRDLQDRNETVRLLKIDLYKAKHIGGMDTTVLAVTAAKDSPHQAAPQHTSSGPLGGSADAAPSALRWLRTLTYRKMMYLVVALFVALLVLSSLLFQSQPIAMDTAMQEALKECNNKLIKCNKKCIS